MIEGAHEGDEHWFVLLEALSYPIEDVVYAAHLRLICPLHRKLAPRATGRVGKIVSERLPTSPMQPLHNRFLQPPLSGKEG